jgi:hypothetical protein
MNPSVAMRPMFVWRDPNGVLVADVLHGVKMTSAGARAVYVARVQGEYVEKAQFSCAKRVIEDWLRKNCIKATAMSA